MESKAEDTTNKLNQMDSPEDLDVFVKQLMDNMVSCSVWVICLKMEMIFICGSWCMFTSSDQDDTWLQPQLS